MGTAQECSESLCECVRLAALTDDLQTRDQLMAIAWLWLAPAMPALRAARGDWPRKRSCDPVNPTTLKLRKAATDVRNEACPESVINR